MIKARAVISKLRHSRNITYELVNIKFSSGCQTRRTMRDVIRKKCWFYGIASFIKPTRPNFTYLNYIPYEVPFTGP